jgi:hypothetical protein
MSITLTTSATILTIYHGAPGTEGPFQTLTTTGSSGPATLTGGTLNIPTPTAAGLGAAKLAGGNNFSGDQLVTGVVSASGSGKSILLNSESGIRFTGFVDGGAAQFLAPNEFSLGGTVQMPDGSGTLLLSDGNGSFLSGITPSQVGAESVTEYKDADFTAAVGHSYNVNDTGGGIVVTSPSGTEGNFFNVFVQGGSVTVGGVTYSDGQTIKAHYVGGGWEYNVYSAESTIGTALVTAADASAARTAIDLGNVDDTSDADKPVSTAQLAALDTKQNFLVAKPNTIKLIIDTDAVEDLGDALAMHGAMTFMDRGDCEILAVGTCLNYPNAAPAMSSVIRYFGYDIPVGKAVGNVTTHDYQGPVMASLDNSIPVNTGVNAESSVSLYRRVLASQADDSVTFVTLGQQVNMKALWDSSADSYSPLTGQQLMTAKIKLLVVAGGGFPTGNEYNFYTDPSTIGWLPLFTKSTVYYGGELGDGTSAGGDIRYSGQASPARAAFLFNGNTGIWDVQAVMYAVYGLSFDGQTLYSLSNAGTITVNTSTGTNGFTESPSGTQRYLIAVANQITRQNTCEVVYSRPPLMTGQLHRMLALGAQGNFEGFTISKSSTADTDYSVGWGVTWFNLVKRVTPDGEAFSSGWERYNKRFQVKRHISDSEDHVIHEMNAYGDRTPDLATILGKSSLYFDGTAPAISSCGNVGASGFTGAFFFDVPSSAPAGTICLSYVGSNQPFWYSGSAIALLLGADGALTVQVRVDGSNFVNLTFSGFISRYAKLKRMHIAWGRGGVWVNGYPITLSSSTTGTATTSSSIATSYYSVSGGESTNYSGRIARAVFLTKTLSDAEVLALYMENAGTVPRSYFASSQVLVYLKDFELSSGGTAPDISGNASDLTIPSGCVRVM